MTAVLGPDMVSALWSATHHRSMAYKNSPGIPAWRGESLRLRRIASGWTAVDLAKRVGVTKSTLLRWELGTNAPTSDHVRLLAKALDVEVSVFSKLPKVV